MESDAEWLRGIARLTRAAAAGNECRLRDADRCDSIAAQLDAMRPVSVEGFLSDINTLMEKCDAVPVGHYSDGYKRALESVTLIANKHFPPPSTNG